MFFGETDCSFTCVVSVLKSFETRTTKPINSLNTRGCALRSACDKKTRLKQSIDDVVGWTRMEEEALP